MHASIVHNPVQFFKASNVDSFCLLHILSTVTHIDTKESGMAYNTDLEIRLHELLDKRDGVTSKKMFGGLAFLLDEKMFVGIIKDDLMVRLNPEDDEKHLAMQHVRHMDFTGRPMKGYLYVSPEGVESDSELEVWIERSVAFVSTIKKKKKKSKKMKG
jgi:TfoX/Sxy family transcriptional regulator of competence genes